METQKDTGPDGNTKNIRARSWCFTLNNYTEKDIDTIIIHFDKASKYVFQEETGENGTKHLQGFVHWNNPKKFSQLKNINDRIHWEKARNIDASMKYCMKSETRSGKCWTKGIPEPLEIEELKLYDWQEEVIEELKKKPDSRKVWWFIDKEGGKGKTTFCKYIYHKNEKVCLYLGGKANDMKFAIAKNIELGKTPKIILIDYTRSTENFVSYEGIEAIKNGIFFNSKYESGTVIYNIPHVFIFSNFEPDKDRLSEDRWKIINLNNK